MNDLISRQAAIDKFEPWLKVKGYSEGELNMLKAVLYELRFLPPTEPERKRGRWIRHPEQKNIYGGKCVECSECGEKYVVQYIEDEKYCRNCGADMRGEQDG